MAELVDAQDLKSCGWLHPCRFDSGPRYLAYAPIAQLDRVLDYESSGYRFDSCWVHFFLRELAQLGRALGLGPRGRRFESCIPDSYEEKKLNICLASFFCLKAI